MADLDYKRLFADTRTELEHLHAIRANLEAKLGEVNTKIEAMTKTYNAIAPLVDEAPIPDVADTVLPNIEALKAAGISVAVRWTLDSAPEESFTPLAVRDRLAEHGWDWAKYVNPLATVHTVLVRLSESKAIKEDRTSEGKKRFYSANRLPLSVPVLSGQTFTTGLGPIADFKINKVNAAMERFAESLIKPPGKYQLDMSGLAPALTGGTKLSTPDDIPPTGGTRLSTPDDLPPRVKIRDKK